MAGSLFGSTSLISGRAPTINRTRLEIPPGVINRRSRSPNGASGPTASETWTALGFTTLTILPVTPGPAIRTPLAF